MAGLQFYLRGSSRLSRFQPAPQANAPVIALPKAGKPVFGDRGDQIISLIPRKLKKPVSHPGANRMLAPIIAAGVTNPVSEKPGQGILAAHHQICSQNISCHEAKIVGDRFPSILQVTIPEIEGQEGPI
jgi:hypothetical protein